MPNQINQIKNQLKDLLDEKGKLSRKIGELKRRSQCVDAELSHMRILSRRISSAKKQLKELRTEPLNNKIKPLTPSFPSHMGNANASSIAPHTLDSVEIRVINPERSEEWDQYVQTHPLGGLYHLYAFKHIIEASFKHKSYYFACLNAEEKIIGLLPLVSTNSRLFGNYLTSIPYFNYSGPLSDHPAIDKLLIKHAWDFMRDKGISHIEIRDTRPREGLPVKLEKSNLILALPDHKETLWNGLGSKVRAQIKKGLANGLEFKIGNEGLLNDFYKVYSTNMRDLGTPVYGKSFFKNILQHTELKATITVLYYNNHAVSCGFLIGYKDTLEIPWASTLRKANALNANMVLYWHILCYAISRNYGFFDFGRSSNDAGTYRFKKQWGAKPAQLYWHYCLPENEGLPQLNPNNPKYKLAIRVWKKLPVFVTQLIGPLIARNLP